MGEIPIVEAKSEKASEEFVGFMKKWRGKWNGKIPSVSQIVAKYIDKKFEKDRPDNEDFITNFLVVAVNALIKCIQNNRCHYKFLYSTMHKENIKNLNWCQYVFDSLIKNHVDWRKQSSKGFYKGPLQFLMLFYFDRVQRLGKKPPRTIPIISVWKRDMVLERIKNELELGLGKGKILPRIVEEAEISPEIFMNDFIDVVIETGRSLSKLSSKLLKAKEIFPENDLVKKVVEVMGKVAREQSILSQDEEIYGSEDFLNAIAEAKREFFKAADMEKNKKGKQKKEEFNINKAFSLGLTPPSPQIDTTNPTSTTMGVIAVEASASVEDENPTGKSPPIELANPKSTENQASGFVQVVEDNSQKKLQQLVKL
ncbi:uncharacterized protein LOC110738152 [Chenopodium quinoa]|uniref:uncharacterized protein LOC110738152 n=1 Tax=Chenopodium quinoa TaxID=63459 RepID=UPI000B78EBFE|nr:uncharacterized protein LOC110738152 [Chenopodium quinoa]